MSRRASSGSLYALTFSALPGLFQNPVDLARLAVLQLAAALESPHVQNLDDGNRLIHPGAVDLPTIRFDLLDQARRLGSQRIVVGKNRKGPEGQLWLDQAFHSHDHGAIPSRQNRQPDVLEKGH